AGDLEMMQFAQIMRILSLLEAGNLDEMHEHVRSCRVIIERLRVSDVSAVAVPACHAGLIAHIAGRLDEFQDVAKRMESLAVRTREPFVASIADVQRLFLRLEQNRAPEAVDIIGPWATMFPTMQPWQAGITMCLALAGSTTEARGRLRGYV